MSVAVTSRLLGLGFLFTMVCQTQGAPVLGNLAQPHAEVGVPVTANAWQASSFEIAEGTPTWHIESVTLRLQEVGPNATLTLIITGEAAFRPNLQDQRVHFESPIFDGDRAIFLTKTAPAPLLVPGEPYWVVLGVEALSPEHSNPAGLYLWDYALNQVADEGVADGWSHGVNTASAGTNGANWAPEQTTPYSFSISANRNLSPMTLSRWRTANPGGEANNDAFLASDPDGNELNGLAEFAFDGNPEYLPQSITDAEGKLGLAYTRWSHAPELTWSVKVSTDLIHWRVLTEVESLRTISLTGTNQERVSVWLLDSPSCVFLRVDVTRS